ncbi:hypothetical protein AB0L13_13645 [Saccharopolyspora shandongensis]|uniref:hypothetical protein n=1 Tax=Saccharopolyspora shandongensis TaxID=418495 RepID=UPI003412E4FE
MSPETAPDPPSRKPVIDRWADWRRNHWGLYCFPGMAILYSVFVFVGTLSLYSVVGLMLGIVSVVAHYCSGRAEKVRGFLVFEFGAMALAVVAFLIAANSR